ncbi:52 kDa repressor of the inhibitor of the protein kinase-like [Aphis gossypii]|uniref:52 kDa repressor of the inhibitor of the protein kinase-like n=1 Tax=Aphis gossypii TaxID=80765 RepID=UPI002158B6D6|nr:52 kDa repressor of the inhibitor of the protein kinase-like [Aphis gossypii]
MSGAFNGVQAVIRKSYPLALYIHCAAHVLNLSVSNSCSVQGIRNCLGTISKPRDFFIYPKQRYHAVNDFLELFECIIKSLDLISNWTDSDTSTQATKGFDLGLLLSKQLQRINIDLVEAMSLAEDTLKEFQTLRTNVDIEFHAIFEDSKGLANTFIEQLKSRFIDHKNTILDFKSLISVEQNETTFLKLAKTYTTDLSECQDSILLSEYKLWQRRLKNVETCNLPKNAMETIILCNQEIYPNVFKLLQIFATLPVSSSSNERTFSNLKRIKTYLRNTISQKRLNGLTMLSIHRNEQITTDDVLKELSLKKSSGAKRRNIINDTAISNEPFDFSSSVINSKFEEPPTDQLFNFSLSPSVKKGSGLYKDVIPHTQLVYYDDPNELVARLNLLTSSQNAGNTGVNNEIISIIEELSERNIIV